MEAWLLLAVGIGVGMAAIWLAILYTIGIMLAYQVRPRETTFWSTTITVVLMAFFMSIRLAPLAGVMVILLLIGLVGGARYLAITLREETRERSPE